MRTGEIKYERATNHGHFQDPRIVVEFEQPGNIAATDLRHGIFLQTKINVSFT